MPNRNYTTEKYSTHDTKFTGWTQYQKQTTKWNASQHKDIEEPFPIARGGKNKTGKPKPTEPQIQVLSVIGVVESVRCLLAQITKLLYLHHFL